MSIDLRAIRQRADVCLSVAVHTRDQMDRRIEVGPEGVFVHLFADAPIKSSAFAGTIRGR